MAWFNTLKIFLVLSCSLILNGCASSPFETKLTTITLHATPDANNHAIVHITATECSQRAFNKITYEQAYASLLSSTPIQHVVLRPNTVNALVLQRHKIRSNVCLYFFLRHPHPQQPWKIMLAQPLQNHYEITVGRDRIVMWGD